MSTDSDVIGRIRDRAAELTEAQRQIAEYVTSSHERAVFLTAAQLARRTGVSESSVVRFAHALGYEGYPHFQRALQEMLRTRLTTVDRLLGSAESLERDGDIVERVMASDVDSIRTTLRELDRESFQRVVDALLNAGRIHVIGQRGASGLAHILGFGLNWVLRNVSIPAFAPGDALDSMMSVEADDLVFAISFPRYTRATLDMLEIAAERGAVTVALTDSVMSPLAEHADLLLTARSGQVSYADSLCAPLSLINALLAAVGTRDRQLTADALAELEEIWEDYGIYTESSRTGASTKRRD